MRTLAAAWMPAVAIVAAGCARTEPDRPSETTTVVERPNETPLVERDDVVIHHHDAIVVTIAWGKSVRTGSDDRVDRPAVRDWPPSKDIDQGVRFGREWLATPPASRPFGAPDSIR